MIDRDTLCTVLSDDLGVDIPSDINAATSAAMAAAMDSPTERNIVLFSRLSQLKAVYYKRVPTDEAARNALKEKALTHFLEVEEQVACFPPIWRFDERVLNTARYFIWQVLGDPKRLSNIFSDCSFGPGATYKGKGPVGRHILTKIGGRQTVTQEAGPLAAFILSSMYPNWYGCLRDLPTLVVPGNRVEFVPKDERKDRQIAIEPSINMFLQLGVGNYISRRLELFGCNLRDQGRNQSLAYEGSVTGAYATIDLSDASNRISESLVKDLLPSGWFELLNSLRSKVGILPSGENHVHAAFSTQGNGFTFPLESLIFLAIVRAATRGVVSVYGDDIIVHSSQYQKAVEALELCGFKVNMEKSFSDGPFRESCGADFILGHYVRPVYYKQDAENDSDVACLHNNLWARWPELRRTRAYLLSCVKNPAMGPSAYVSDVGEPGVNRTTDIESEWFWSGEPSTKLIGNWYLTRKYVMAPVRIKPRSTNYAKLLTFLYGGSRTLASSSIVKERIRKSRIHHETILAWYTPHSLLD